MHRRRATLVLALVASMAAVACGPRAQITSGGPGSPRVEQAAQAVTGGPLRYDGDISARLDLTGASGVDPSTFGPLASGVSLEVSGERESSARSRTRITSPTLGRTTLTLVRYDGDLFVSTDGTRFKRVHSAPHGASSASPSPSSAPGGAGLGDPVGLLGKLGDLRDLGQTTQDGQDVERYQLTLQLDKVLDVIDQQLAQHGGSGGEGIPPAVRAVMPQVVQLQHAALDAYLTKKDALLDRVAADLAVRIDLTKLSMLARLAGTLNRDGAGGASSIPGLGTAAGSALFSLAGGAHLFDQGTQIRIPRPVDDPNAPDPGALIGGLLGAA